VNNPPCRRPAQPARITRSAAVRAPEPSIGAATGQLELRAYKGARVGVGVAAATRRPMRTCSLPGPMTAAPSGSGLAQQQRRSPDAADPRSLRASVVWPALRSPSRRRPSACASPHRGHAVGGSRRGAQRRAGAPRTLLAAIDRDLHPRRRPSRPRGGAHSAGKRPVAESVESLSRAPTTMPASRGRVSAASPRPPSPDPFARAIRAEL
jgi:hypothetical protein